MLQLKKIAVTGALSSGKTCVCHILQGLGAYVLNADSIVHQLLKPETEVGRSVIKWLGPNVIEQGRISRSKIAKKVFAKKELIQGLENLIHPQVKQVIEAEYQNVVKQKRYALFVVEIPLLFEAGWQDEYDAILVVTADPVLCARRFCERTGSDESEFTLRMANQWPVEEKLSSADYIIVNNRTIEDLETDVKKIYKQLTSRS